MIPERKFTARKVELGQTFKVFGWYDFQEWVEVIVVGNEGEVEPMYASQALRQSWSKSQGGNNFK